MKTIAYSKEALYASGIGTRFVRYVHHILPESDPSVTPILNACRAATGSDDYFVYFHRNTGRRVLARWIHKNVTGGTRVWDSQGYFKEVVSWGPQDIPPTWDTIFEGSQWRKNGNLGNKFRDFYKQGEEKLKAAWAERRDKYETLAKKMDVPLKHVEPKGLPDVSEGAEDRRAETRERVERNVKGKISVAK